MAKAPGGARTPRSDPGSGPPSERNRPEAPPPHHQGGRAGKNQDETKCHCAPFAWITRASLFCVTGAKRGKDSAVTVPAHYRPTGARLQPRPVLTIP
jgi:hypothetical protein